MAQPGGKEALAAVFSDQALDLGLVGFGGGGAERQCHVGQAELEQPIAAAGLAVIIPLGRGAREDLDLPVVQCVFQNSRTAISLNRGHLFR